MIQGTNLNKSFGKKQILSNINIQIKKGEVTVVRGSSGSGKTTLLRCLTLLEKPDSGKIFIDEDILEFPSKRNDFESFYPKITIVYQQLFLWPHLTNRENICLAISKKINNQDKLLELIDYFQMEAFIDNYPNQSSVGQKQRIAIARALVLNPSYIFFDEITSALDSKQIDNMIQIVYDLKKQGIGMFFITHDDRVANKIGDTQVKLI